MHSIRQMSSADLCPFCIHDDALPVPKRFRSFTNAALELCDHIGINHMKQYEGVYPCPASIVGCGYIEPTCSNATPLTRADLIEHLHSEHDLPLDALPSHTSVADDSAVSKPTKRRRIVVAYDLQRPNTDIV